MDFVRRVLLVLCTGTFGVGTAGGEGMAVSTFAQRWRRRTSYVLCLLLVACVMPSLANADAAGCASVVDWLASANCYGPDYPNYPMYTLSCYTIPAPGNPGVTQVWGVTSSATYTFAPAMLAEYACSNDPSKNAGQGGPGTPMVGDPINASNGNKFLKESDYVGSPWLTFHRFYNSQGVTLAEMGPRWRHSFDRSLQVMGSSPTTIVMLRPDGTQEVFTKANGVWTGDTGLVDTLTEIDNAQGVLTSYTVFIGAERHIETYNTYGVLQTVTDETGQGITLTYSTASTPTSVAPKAGLLVTVTDPNGRQLNFTYTSSGNVSQVIQPDGGTLTYTYNTTGNLVSVQYPGSSTRQYVYNESALTGGTNLPNVITGVMDESGVRYASTTYNSSGEALSSSFVGNVNTTQVTYNASGTATVLYPLGFSSTLSFVTVQGVNKLAALDQACGPQCGQSWKTLTYDTSGNPASSTDFNGNITATTYNSVGLLTQQIDAQGQPTQRTTNTTWNTVLRVPLTRTVLNASGTTVAQTGWAYNSTDQTLARCEIDPTQAGSYTCAATGTVPAGVRRTTYTYCTAVDTVQCPLVGLLLSTTGPRTDLTQTTSYSYYMSSSATSCGTPGAACHQAGDLYQVTDAAGHVTTIASYDADGRITRTTDANGVNTDLTYTPRGWLASRAVGGATTSFTYTPYGSVATVTDPDNVTTTYTYDAAHRLTKITDALGNYVQYTLDAASNKTAEQVYDSTGTLHKSLTRTYNTLGQLTATMDGLNTTVFNAGYSDSYDANGNLVHSADALSIQRKLGYDALNRLVSTIANYNGTDTATQNTTTGTTYDSLDRLTQVTDPSSLVTSYQFDGLSNATGQTSPDTGTTTRTFDAAGNVLTRTDAKSITVTNTYDALNRLTSVSYADATQNIAVMYDEANSVTGCSNSSPVGRLTRIVEVSVTTVYCYDARGNITRKQQITGTGTDSTAYTYTAGNRLSSITYPSGSQASYAFDADGRIQTVTLTPVGGSAGTAVSSVSYLPFGPVVSYTLGNGQTIARTFDANYRLTDLTSPAFNLHVARDASGDITALGNAPGANPAIENYSYDPLYRLTGVTDAGASLESFTYNPTGDRLSKTGSGLATGTYSYNPNTHQLIATGNAARSVDADGNTTAITQAGSTYGFGYSARNRMTVAQANSATVGSYTYNALGQRIGKSATATERFVYNEGSQLLSEYGTSNRDYVWLGDLPVATVDETTSGGATTSTISYVTADQLGTPRAVANTSGTTIWSLPYQGNAFGEQSPTSSNGYALNLRFPGQYFDQESGLSDNGMRSFESGSGGYAQSDPMGLFGGQSSTYAYGGGNPLSFSDPMGLQNTAPAICAMCHSPVAPLPLPGTGQLSNEHSWPDAPDDTLPNTDTKPKPGCDDNDQCWTQREVETQECHWKYDDLGPEARPIFNACMARVVARWQLCLRSRGQMPENAPGEWNDSDWEGWPTIHDLRMRQ